MGQLAGIHADMAVCCNMLPASCLLFDLQVGKSQGGGKGLLLLLDPLASIVISGGHVWALEWLVGWLSCWLPAMMLA